MRRESFSNPELGRFEAPLKMLTIVCGMSCILKVALSFHAGMTKKKILIAFGNKVRELRKEMEFSQEELSFKADLHRTYIGMIERGEKNITLTNIKKIAKALNVKAKDLLDDEL